jgi:hypothetical protein
VKEEQNSSYCLEERVHFVLGGSMSAARRGKRDRTSLRSNHFAEFCIQQCFAAFVARGLLLTSA